MKHVKDYRLHGLLVFSSSTQMFVLHQLSVAYKYRQCSLTFYMFQVQNLEKAGILNKTKVSENGKKVR